MPQSSLLSPLLFIININDTLVDVFSSSRMFADDCAVYSEIIYAQDSLSLKKRLGQHSVMALVMANYLEHKKTVQVAFRRNVLPPEFSYSLNEGVLESVHKVKYLGVYSTSYQWWGVHADYISIKASRMLGILPKKFKREIPSLK